MNNKKLSLFMIVLTVFCVSIILYSNKELTNQRSANEKVEGGNSSGTNNGKVADKGKIKLENDNTASVPNKTEQKKKPVTTNNNSKKNNENSNSATIKNRDQNEDQNTLTKKDAAVFKVSKGDIKGMLSLSDKQKIFAIALKLSASDYNRIKGYLEDGDDESIVKALKLLKDRLSEKDYEKLKTVADKFVNMDVVEGK